jgi:DMSO/TMAO reductase YedYZ molybdopterin-dependent catalytic subunit
MVRVPRSLSSVPPPPGPFRRSFWRSPIRGPWLTAFFGSILLVGVTLMFATGLLSYDAYNPGLGHNATDRGHHLSHVFLFDWPTHPYWLYRVTQGVHVTLGLVLIPVLLGKLWSVIPKLFEWPPVRSLAHMIERLSLLLLVGGAVFEFVTGIMNIQYFYRFPGSFYVLHLYGAWVFMAAFVVHVGMKFPKMVRALRSRRMRDVLRTDVAHTEPEPPDPDHLVSPSPARPTMSRRGAIGLVGASSLTVFVVTAGQSIGGWTRHLAVLAPRDADISSGPNGFQINKRAAQVGIKPEETGASWRLTLHGPPGSHPIVMSRAQLLAMPQHTAHLPIACVEGWSSGNQKWTGIPLRDLATMAGVPDPSSLYVQSLQKGGEFSRVTLRGNQVMNLDSLLALTVNDVDLSMDHGFPARIIVPANPGVHNTKWVSQLTFMA